MANTKTFAIILVMVVVSLMGFCVENIFIGFNRGFMDNRNMILPFLFGYGLSILAVYLLFGTPTDPKFWGKEIAIPNGAVSTLYYFIIAFLGVSVGEILLGYATEWACGIIWWDYTSIPLHITRYTSVPTSAAFASLITVFMKFFFYPLLTRFSRMNPKVLAFIAVTFTVILSLDMINSAFYMFKHRATLSLWKINFKRPFKDIIADIVT